MTVIQGQTQETGVVLGVGVVAHCGDEGSTRRIRNVTTIRMEITVHDTQTEATSMIPIRIGYIRMLTMWRIETGRTLRGDTAMSSMKTEVLHGDTATISMIDTGRTPHRDMTTRGDIMISRTETGRTLLEDTAMISMIETGRTLPEETAMISMIETRRTLRVDMTMTSIVKTGRTQRADVTISRTETGRTLRSDVTTTTKNTSRTLHEKAAKMTKITRCHTRHDNVATRPQSVMGN